METHCAACPGKTAHAMLFTEFVTTFHAQAAMFVAAHIVPFTTEVHEFMTLVAVFHTTFVAVETVP